jgi:hypothetical protein
MTRRAGAARPCRPALTAFSQHSASSNYHHRLVSSRKLMMSAAVLLAAGAFVMATRGIAPPTPNPPGTFSFAALGDAPYVALHGDMLRYRLVVQELDAHDLDFVLHVGDILDGACSDDRFRQRRDQFNALRHPVIYTPGDNEWTDCWESRSGGFAPLDRLASLRRTFFAPPTRSLGGRSIQLATQAGREPFAEFAEHARWTHKGLMFVTVNLPGSWNAREPFTARTVADDEASTRRTDAAAAWLRETFAEARTAGSTAVIVGFHANPGFESPAPNEYRQSYEPFMTTLEEEVESFGRPVLVAQGDNHEFIVDHPLVRRTTGRRLDNLTRLQVPGSPDVGWVRVVVTPGAQPTFTFENRVVPRWKHW